MLSPVAPKALPSAGRTERWRERQRAPFSVAWCTGTALIWINVSLVSASPMSCDRARRQTKDRELDDIPP
jgi:hypothetical protein